MYHIVCCCNHRIGVCRWLANAYMSPSPFWNSNNIHKTKWFKRWRYHCVASPSKIISFLVFREIHAGAIFFPYATTAVNWIGGCHYYEKQTILWTNKFILEDTFMISFFFCRHFTRNQKTQYHFILYGRIIRGIVFHISFYIMQYPIYSIPFDLIRFAGFVFSSLSSFVNFARWFLQSSSYYSKTQETEKHFRQNA